ncbi:MAG TPA: class IV adenylate cyclase [Pirellulales bacterium]|jgi:adenylate cyclase class 2|nr:class IV adenylate cyclase [Pirellulales bacterium]
MPLEVEQKYRLENPAAVWERLAALGARWNADQQQADRYFNHPAHDFARSDESLRIRTIGDDNFITYKGPKLDQTTKTRREIELPLVAGAKAAEQYAELLAALGFRFVAEVNKCRRPGTLAWEGFEVQLAWDQIERLGSFLELELITEESGQQQAKACLASLAHELALKQSERRSYLELLLTADPSAAPVKP